MNEHFDTKSSNKALWLTGIIIAFLVVALITNGFGLFNPKNPITGSSTGIPKIALSIDSSPVLGNTDAPVTIYEFSDFSCQYCSIANNNAVKDIIKDYVETGKAKLVFKYFPGHGAGTAAHIIGYALQDQNPELFWKFADIAFNNQADIGNLDKMKSIASDLGADMTALESFIISNKATYLIQQDTEMGKSNGIQGTPSFIINDKIIVGAQPFSEFKKVIDKEI
jgi:protein-disulfide isomerase